MARTKRAALRKPRESNIKKPKTELEKEETRQVEISCSSSDQNDFEELKMIYESAFKAFCKSSFNDANTAFSSKKSKNEFDEESKMMFRGVVHECDKMVRIRQDNPRESVPHATEEELALLLDRVQNCLPAEFHLIYANALYYLSLMLEKKEDQSVADFLEEAIYRIGVAMEMDPTCSVIHCSLVRSLMQKVLITGGKWDKETIDAVEKEMDNVFVNPITTTLPKDEIFDAALEIAHLYTSLLDLQNTLESKIEWAEKAAKYWTLLLNRDEGNSKTIIGLASCWLNIADISIEYLEENPTSKAVSSDRIQTFLENAISQLEKIVEEMPLSAPSTSTTTFSTATPSPVDGSFIQSQILLGECHVHMGNLLDTEEEGGDKEEDKENEESLAHYRQAVQLFQKVQQIQPGALPDQFEEFLSEWLLDMQ